MWTPPTLSEARRVAGNKANFNALFGQPANWMDAERTLNEMRPQTNPQSAIQNPQSPPPGRLIPPSPLSPAPMKRVNPLNPTAPPRFFGAAPTPFGQVPAGIAAANPEAYFDPRSGSTVIGDPNHVNQRNVGGKTWSGGAVQNGQAFFNNNTASFGMPAPNERRGPTGGRGAPPAPDMFGRQFGGGKAADGPDPFAAAPDLDPASPYYDKTAAQQARVDAFKPRHRFADGGTIMGPGGPTDDMIPAMVDGVKPIAVSNGEEIVDAETRDFFGRKFFLDLKKKAEKGMEEASMEHGEPRSEDIPVRSGMPPSMMMPGFAGGGTIPDPMLDAISQSATRARMNDGFSPVAYGPTMNDHPAFQPPQPMAFGVQPAVSQASPIPVMPPMFDPQPPVPTFAQPPFNNSSATVQPSSPFLAPWEKDAARTAAADAASGRPEGVRKSDWRKFQRTPQGMMFGIQRQDQAAQDAQRERVRLDEQAVAVNRDLFRTNTGIQMDAMNRAAGREDAANARAVDENYRMATENRKIGNEAAIRAAENSAPPQDIPGTDYVRTAYGNLPKTRPDPIAPAGMVPKSMTVGGVRYEVPEGDKPAGPLKIRAKLQPKGDFEMVQWSDGLILPSPRNISPTDKQKEEAYKAVTGQALDSKNPEHWSDAYYFARGERPPKWTQSQPAQAPAQTAAPREFKTPEEAMKAGLKPGDRVMVGGRAATWK